MAPTLYKVFGIPLTVLKATRRTASRIGWPTTTGLLYNK